jgi:alanine dehydrogenase
MSKRVFISQTIFQATPQEMLMETPIRSDSLYIGIPKEQSPHENRIALVPSSVQTLTANGHRIVIEAGAGERSHFTDIEFSEAGAEIIYDTKQVYEANIILKVAPFTIEEIAFLRPNQIIIAPLHIPSLQPEVVRLLKQKRITAIAMNYIKDASGAFPLVRAVSEIAGASAVLTAAELLTNAAGGRGVLLGGVAGVPPIKVVILGAGMVAEAAARTAIGLGADIRVFENNIYKLMRLQRHLGRQIFTSTFHPKIMKQEILSAHIVIGALHSSTGRAPCLVSEELVSKMKRGAVIVDISIDQGGCFATSRPTDHHHPTYRIHDVIHYCVPNIASRVAQTASNAMSNILAPMLLRVADAQSFEQLIYEDTGIQHGVFTFKGCLTNAHIGAHLQMNFTDIVLLMPSQY